MKNWIITLLVFILPVIGYFSLKNSQEVRNSMVAQAIEKPTVLKFESPMCSDCQKLKKEMEPLRTTYAQSINFIDVNATALDSKTQKQVEMYGVTVVPTIIFLDSNKNKMNKIEGFTTKEVVENNIKELING